jgi:hypothetical protein
MTWTRGRNAGHAFGITFHIFFPSPVCVYLSLHRS